MLGNREGGNETYVAGLLAGLGELAAPDVEVTALVDPRLPRHAGDRWPGIEFRRLPTGRSVPRLLFEVPVACRAVKADIVHMTYNASLRLPCSLVLSVHDVLFRRFAGFFSPRDRLLLNTLMPFSMSRATRILTLSEASRADILAYYPRAKDRIDVIPLAAGPVAAAVPDFSAVRRICGEDSFVLAVGTIQPRKNLARLVKAFALLKSTARGRLRLVIVGKPQWRSKDVYGLAGRDLDELDVAFTGYVSDAELAGLYRRCSAFVFPSLGEGFGLPVLEAMACGAPVITSSLSSLPEVTGEAAYLVDPYSTAEMAQAMGELLSDRSLADELRGKGLEQAKKFSWLNTARLTVDAYRRVTAARDH
jgi:glycosyltransferase involved in cell wall biosynthesis